MFQKQFSIVGSGPFRLDLTVWTLRRRPSNAVDRWDGHQYVRILVINGQPVKVSVTQSQMHAETFQLEVELQSHSEITEQNQREIEILLTEMLGLNCDMQPFYEMAQNDQALKVLVKQFRGVRPPRFPTLFEALMNAVACQQLSLDVGIIMLNRLSANYGLAFMEGEDIAHAFPEPEALIDIPPEDLKSLGLSRQKARAIDEIARAFVDDEVDIDALKSLANSEAIVYLANLRGIGRWSAEYVLLRGLGRLDSLPADDVGAQNNLQRMFALDHKPAFDEVRELTARWHPYEGLVYFHMLLAGLHRKNLL